MSKIINTRSVTGALIVIAVVTGLFFILRFSGRERVLNAFVTPTEITMGESIFYNDSTRGAENWLWEFGNGDYSIEQGGEYHFPQEGYYRVRLQVDGKLEKHFMVKVNPGFRNINTDHLIRINAPEAAMQGEFILFTAEGDDHEWRWEFGESGVTDSREKTAIYAYDYPGIYEVLLSSENTQYPVIHQIEIYPRYEEDDSLNVMSVIGNDIKLHLQEIVQGNPFNANYNHILNSYLCGNPDVLVTVNNNKRNDFYSYCQGLRLAGQGNTKIETVSVESGDMDGGCIDHIIVIQYDRAELTPASPANTKQNETP